MNVREHLRDEGAAQLNAAIARDEILAAGGSDIGIPGTQTAKYNAVYEDYKAGNLTRDEALDKMADLMGNESTSTTGENYRQYYGKAYEAKWARYEAAQAAAKAVKDAANHVVGAIGGN